MTVPSNGYKAAVNGRNGSFAPVDFNRFTNQSALVFRCVSAVKLMANQIREQRQETLVTAVHVKDVGESVDCLFDLIQRACGQ